MFIFMLIAIFSFEYFGENAIIPQVVTSMAYFLQANVTSYMFNTNVTFYYKLHFRWRYLNVLIQWEVRTLFFFFLIGTRYATFLVSVRSISCQCQVWKYPAQTSSHLEHFHIVDINYHYEETFISTLEGLMAVSTFEKQSSFESKSTGFVILHPNQ